jgi:prepilin-type N-terminal cleavage/methylation domain-containing protein/prepilin-type processing-associated H-X9-DG protein
LQTSAKRENGAIPLRSRHCHQIRIPYQATPLAYCRGKARETVDSESQETCPIVFGMLADPRGLGPLANVTPSPFSIQISGSSSLARASAFLPMRRMYRKFSGFTLVELLVVIAIIGILVGLLLPAVQAAREAARRMQCSNNLKQIGLALHNYESAHRWWPAQSTGPAPGVNFNAKRGSWMSAILPFIEQEGLFRTYDPSFNWHDTNNATAVGARLPFYNCPSTPQRNNQFEWTVLVNYANSTTTTATTSPRSFFNGATTDYTNVGGLGTQLNATLPTPHSDPVNSGILKQTQVRLGEVSDGLSNTLLVAECAGRPDLYQRNRLVLDGATPKTWSGTASVTRPFPTGGVWASHLKGFLIDGALPDGNTAIRPGTCSINCSNDNELYAFHTGGANVSLADGSVRMLSQSMAIIPLASLVTRNGGEVASIDE